LLLQRRAAIDRYLLRAGPTAANPPQTDDAAVNSWDRDGQTPYRYVGPASYYKVGKKAG